MTSIQNVKHGWKECRDKFNNLRYMCKELKTMQSRIIIFVANEKTAVEVSNMMSKEGVLLNEKDESVIVTHILPLQVKISANLIINYDIPSDTKTYIQQVKYCEPDQGCMLCLVSDSQSRKKILEIELAIQYPITQISNLSHFNLLVPSLTRRV